MALGDSYSAGVGEGGTDGACDRDWRSYAARAFDDLGATQQIKKGSFDHRACSGGVTGDYWARRHERRIDEAPQRDAINRETDVVTLTFGGNDISFASKIYGCLIGDCGADLYSLSAGNNGSACLGPWGGCTGASSTTWDNVYQRLVSIAVDARSRMARGGHVYMLSYPAAFAVQSNNFGGVSCHTFGFTEQRAANALATRLGDTIYLAAHEAERRVGNVHFVDWRTGSRSRGGYTVPSGYSGAGTKFDLHVPSNGICNRERLPTHVNGLTYRPKENSLHPNALGYQFAADLLVRAVRSNL